MSAARVAYALREGAGKSYPLALAAPPPTCLSTHDLPVSFINVSSTYRRELVVFDPSLFGLLRVIEQALLEKQRPRPSDSGSLSIIASIYTSAGGGKKLPHFRTSE